METLGQRLTRGDQAAFAELYDACADRCRHFIVALLGSSDAADEVMQEAFLRLVRNRKKLGAVDNPAAYLFATARNEAIRHGARRSREAGRHASSELLFAEATSADPEKREWAELAMKALETLNAAEREVVELKIYGGLTFREIALVIETPLQTAATRYRSALARLKSWLQGQPK